MLKYFQKTRLKLLNEGNLKRYLIYAVGEILLVMIGILLALQVNNWNEKRKDSSSEFAALLDLKQEFSKNTKIFENHNDFKKEVSQNWMKFVFNISNQELTDSERIITPVRPGVRTYNPSKSILNSLLSTGKIDKIENDSLKYYLTNWNDILLDYLEDEARHLEFWDKEMVLFERSLLPYRFYQLGTIDSLRNVFHAENETKKMFLLAYNNLEYQNLLLRNLYFLQENINNGEFLLTTYNTINRLLNDEISMKRK